MMIFSIGNCRFYCQLILVKKSILNFFYDMSKSFIKECNILVDHIRGIGNNQFRIKCIAGRPIAEI